MTAGVRQKVRLYTKTGTEAPWYSGWQLTDAERDRFRQTTLRSIEAKAQACQGTAVGPRHAIPTPKLDPALLMPMRQSNGIRALSLFSGGGGLDIGFERAGFDHEASFDIMDHAGVVLKAARPDWQVRTGFEGDVTLVDWQSYRGTVDIIHGGPPCQPFSIAGRRKGASDVRDMLPELVRAVREIKPRAFVCENVAGLSAKKFDEYLQKILLGPLGRDYSIQKFTLDATDFGVPQRRRRIFFVGFRTIADTKRFNVPKPSHSAPGVVGKYPPTLGAREALGLPDIGFDDVVPTIRSGLTGPRHTTSIVNSSTAARLWAQLKIWPNGVGANREAAAQFPAKHGHYRLSVADCMVLQGFPSDWPITGAVYKALGLIGNSVAPPMGYAVACAVADALI